MKVQRSAEERLTDLITWLSQKHKDAGDGRCLEDVEDWPCTTIQAVRRAEA